MPLHDTSSAPQSDLPAAHAGNDEFTGNALDTAWVTVNPGGTFTVAQGNGRLGMWVTGAAGGTGIAYVKPITISQGGYVETHVNAVGYPQSSNNPLLAGLVLTDGTSTSSNHVFLGMYTPGGGSGGVFFCGGALNSFNGTPGGLSSEHQLTGNSGGYYLRLIWQGANTWRCNVSLGGDLWHQLGIADVSKTITPTQMGFCVSDFGGTGPGGMASFEYLRCSG